MKRIVGLLLFTLTATACSSSPPRTGPVNAGFVSYANQACTGALNEVSPTPFPWANFNATDPLVSQLPAAGAYFDAVTFNHKELAFVQKFGKPKQGQKTWQAFVTLVGQQQDAVGRQITAAKASNKTAFVASVREIAANAKQIDSAAAAAGFAKDSSCTQLFG